MRREITRIIEFMIKSINFNMKSNMKSRKKQEVYKLNKGFITQKIKGETTIFDGENSQLITFNESATFIFEKLKKGLDDQKIIEQISRRFKIDSKKAAQDVGALLHQLKKLKVIS